MTKAVFAAYLILAWELVSVEAIRHRWDCYDSDTGILEQMLAGAVVEGVLACAMVCARGLPRIGSTPGLLAAVQCLVPPIGEMCTCLRKPYRCVGSHSRSARHCRHDSLSLGPVGHVSLEG